MSVKKINLPSVEERRSSLENHYQNWSRETLASHFKKVCENYKTRDFIVTQNDFSTYGEIWENAEKYAKALMGMGVQPRDHIAVLMENHPDYVSLLIASSLVGAVFIPVNTMLKKQELTYVLTQSDSKFLFFNEKIKKNNYAEMIVALWQEKKFQQQSKLIKAVRLGEQQDLKHDKIIEGSEFLKKSDTIADQDFRERQEAAFYPDEISIIMYTSGSIGQSKGVMLSHDMLLRGAYATCLCRAIEEGRVTFAALPFYHCFNMIEGILAMSFVGGKLIAPNLFTPLSALKMMEKFKANDFLCVPSMLVPLLNQKDIESFDLTHLYAIWCGAAPAPITVWEKATRLLGLKEICTGYGQTEVSSSGVITEMGDPLSVIIRKVGRPKLGGIAGLKEFNGSIVQYKTIDTDTGETLAAGSIGELVVRGNTVTKGYYKKPEETAETIDKDGWLKTGDVGRIDENGYLEILGRSKELYKVSGELVAPKEIEAVINQIPAVNQACVVGVSDAITTEAGAVFVELKPGKTCEKDEIIKICQRELARFKVPRYVWFIQPEEWPMTSTGKIQKVKLREMAENRLKSKE